MTIGTACVNETQVTRRRFMTRSATSVALSAVTGCGFIPREPVAPMPTQLTKAGCGLPAKTMIVLLPGRGMTTRELEEEGFVEAVGSLALAADVLLADAHLAYYQQRSILQRLRADVIEPARLNGYRAIWLAGISMGGLGAILYADAYPDDIAGVLAIAPYLGEADSLKTVKDAGGLSRWRPAAPPEREPAISNAIWRSAQSVVQRNDAGAGPPLFLGYGLEDRFAPSHQVLAESLPRARVFTAPGGHDWNPWRGLWQRILAAPELARC